MNLHYYYYLHLPQLTGNIQRDIQALLTQNGKVDTFAHIKAVSLISDDIAEQYGLVRDKCVLAGLLHDISAVIKPEDMLSYIKDNSLPLDEAEKKYPSLLHQRISSFIARDYFGVSDPDILSAMECHSTLKASPSPYDMALFVADKLSWDQGGTPPFYDAVKAGLAVSLEMASLAYIDFCLDSGSISYPHTQFLHAKDWLTDSCSLQQRDENKV